MKDPDQPKNPHTSLSPATKSHVESLERLLPHTWKHLESAGCWLNTVGALEVRGHDALTFLHNLSSCDIKTLKKGEWRKGAFCNPKGRAMFIFDVLRYREGGLLLVPIVQMEPLIKHLSIYIMRADVQLLPQSPKALSIMGIIGADTVHWLVHRHTYVAQHQETEHNEDLILATKDGTYARAYAIGCKDALCTLEKEANLQGIARIDQNAWKYCEILDGESMVYPSTSATWIPQMLNLDLVGAVNFDKGCYPGQEIVARIHYLGNVKKRTFLFTTKTLENLAPGQKVLDETGTEKGGIVDSCPLIEEYKIGLVLLPCADYQQPHFTLGSAPLKILPMPYPMPH